MFETFNDLPLHPLIVHAAVIVVPTTLLVALAMLRPVWRLRLRWPLAGLTALATLLVLVTRMTGENLEDYLDDNGMLGGEVETAVERHADLADQLLVWILVLLAVSVVVALVLPRLTSPVISGLAAFVVVAVALGVTVVTVQTGEAGAKAVWNPTGTVDYGADDDSGSDDD